MIRQFTYQDIPSSLRAKSAGQAHKRLQTVLTDPTATPEQREAAIRQQGVLRAWTQGILPAPAESPVEGPAQDHAITVSETVTVAEG